MIYTYLSTKIRQNVLRNVGIFHSDAGELPRRKLTTKERVVFQNWQSITDGGETTKMMMGRTRPCREVHRSRP
jgi:hypothetical protein